MLARRPGIPGKWTSAQFLHVIEKAVACTRLAAGVLDGDTARLLGPRVALGVWIDPKGEGLAPVCRALHVGSDPLSFWVDERPTCFPPIVIHITDGQSDDGDPGPVADLLRSLHTGDGSVLLFHQCLTMAAAEPVLFPGSAEGLPGDAARRLFQMSSVVPASVRARLAARGVHLVPGARGMSLNTPLLPLVRFFQLGSRVSADWKRHIYRVRRRQLRERAANTLPTVRGARAVGRRWGAPS